MGRTRTTALVAITVGLAVVALSCTPPPTTPPTTTSSDPNSVNISEFQVTVASMAPATVTVSWTVSDPQNDPLTCSIDRDGNGTADLVVPNCNGSASRNLNLVPAGNWTSRITVSDGPHSAIAELPLTVAAGTTETMDVTIRSVDPLDGPVAEAFAQAEARWEGVVVRGITDTTLNLGAGQCLDGAAAYAAPLDDLLIDVRIAPIDGVGNILGAAGPCLIGGADSLTRVGSMEFDSADVDIMVAQGILDEVVTHEMGHILGIGTLWTLFGVTSPLFGSDPRFLGRAAVGEWSALGQPGTPPIEADGGSGTAYAHWDEQTFDTELMTGYIDDPAPLSAISIGSLADLHYRVDLSSADPYTLPGALLRFFSVDGPELEGSFELRSPIGSV